MKRISLQRGSDLTTTWLPRSSKKKSTAIKSTYGLQVASFILCSVGAWRTMETMLSKSTGPYSRHHPT